jgi:tetratricopeptide (TPR) repeat protein
VPAGTAPTTDDQPRLEMEVAWNRILSNSESKTVVKDIQSVFPPDYAAALPDAGARSRWVVGVVQRLLDDDRADDAHRWVEKVPFGAGVEGLRVRAREARKAKRPEAADGFLKTATQTAPDDRGAFEDRLDFLVSEQRVRDAVNEGEAAAAKFSDDGKILASLARALVETEDRPRADQVFTKALAAKNPPPPAGTGLQHARLLQGFSPPRQTEARAALQADGGTYADPAAIEALAKIAIDLHDDAENERLTALLEEVRRSRATERMGWALGWIYDQPEKALGWAREATDYAPSDPETWRLRGVLELRQGFPESATTSLRRAIEAATDKDAERSRVRAWLRMFDQPQDAAEGS